MKKILLEYANMIAYTITGLVFGLAFFLLFINFYHMQEINTSVDIANYNTSNKQEIVNKINIIKANISVYDRDNYSGNLNIYALNAVQANLQKSVEILESQEMMKYFDYSDIHLKDAYNFSIDFRNNVLNDCLVMQIKSLVNTDTVNTLPNFTVIKPYLEFDIDSLTDSSTYIQSNLENADHYYFSTDTNKTNFFDLTKDSYTNIVAKYQSTLDLLVEFSNWYRSIVVGG